MRRKILSIFIIFPVVMALILTSCTTETTSDEQPTVVTGTVTDSGGTTTTPQETVKPIETEEKPLYGGVATIVLTTDIVAFDESFVSHASTHTLKLTNNELLQNDWVKGPAGTGEAQFVHGGINLLSLKTGCLAERWEIPERGKMVFHIRDGVSWHNKFPTNGRALTVDDIVFSIKRDATEPGAYIRLSFPRLADTLVVTGDTASRTVTIECPLDVWPDAASLVPDFLTIMPRDAVEHYGNLNDWRNSIGTGPFMMVDYVSAGSVTFVRNPNYWETNPIGPGKGDRLPYLDGVKMLVITDAATRMAALRTAKVDFLSGLDHDDAREFLRNPDMKSVMYTSDSTNMIGMRVDKPDSPFSKKEVRQALHLATDFNKIVNEYYDGQAIFPTWPLAPSKEYANAYMTLEELPPDVRELFSHNPTRARELLASAGYPQGFSATIICYSTPTHVDFLSLIQSMWAEVGVTLNIDAREYATWVGRLRTRNFDDLFYGASSGVWQRLINFHGSAFWNVSRVDDDYVASYYPQIIENFGIDEAEMSRLHKELMPYVLEQAWVIAKPNPHLYVLWWPWIKNWNGELHTGYYNWPSFLKYVWYDAELKRQMTR